MELNLMPFQDLPFNGDSYLSKEFLRLKHKYNIKTAVETGSCLFSSTKWFGENFDEVYTFENNETFYNAGVHKVQDMSHVHPILNDSVQGLKDIKDNIDSQSIFFLDAHWWDFCPLLDELEVLSTYEHKPIIVIHDFKTDNPEFGYDSYHGQDFDFNFIKEKIENIYPDGYEYFYNVVAENAKRGVIFIVPKYKKKKALIGFGGHAREVMSQMGVNLTCFVDDEYVKNGCLPLSSFNPKEYDVMVAVANSQDRHNIVNKLPKDTHFFTFIHPSALIMDNVEIGSGSFIGAYSILTTNIKLGSHSLLNRSNHIGHDCIVGDYFSAMPGSIISGNVNIGDRVYLGTNSSIREKINICDDVVIGLNTGVVKHISDSGTYVSNSNKKIK